jgi:hypothetical protein
MFYDLMFRKNSFIVSTTAILGRYGQSGPGPAGTETETKFLFFDLDRDGTRTKIFFYRDRDGTKICFSPGPGRNFFSHRDRNQKWLVPLMSNSKTCLRFVSSKNNTFVFIRQLKLLPYSIRATSIKHIIGRMNFTIHICVISPPISIYVSFFE